MRKIFLILIVLIMTVFPVACNENTAEEGSADPQNGSSGNKETAVLPRTTVYSVSKEVLTESVTAEDGTEIIYISSAYPVISNPGDLESVVLINEMYLEGAENYIKAVRNDFEQRALDEYSSSPEGFEKYTFVSDVKITYNKNCFLSVKRDYDECYSGFESKETYAEIFDMTVGAQMYADEIITGSGEDVFKIIFLGFSAVADQFPERFVEGYTDILNSAISSTEFYLTDSGMVFVLQPGIATYAEYGCLEFEMPYEGNEMYFLKLYER